MPNYALKAIFHARWANGLGIHTGLVRVRATPVHAWHPGEGSGNTFSPDHSKARNLLGSLFSLNHWVITLIVGRKPDITQEVIELRAHVQVDLDGRFAPAPVKQRLGGGHALGPGRALVVQRPLSRSRARAGRQSLYRPA